MGVALFSSPRRYRARLEKVNEINPDRVYDVAPGKAWSARREVADDHLKRRIGGQRVRVPPGQSLASRPVASLAWSWGQPAPRSVDSKPVGRVIEPRNFPNRGAGGVHTPEGSIGRAVCLARRIPAHRECEWKHVGNGLANGTSEGPPSRLDKLPSHGSRMREFRTSEAL